MCGLYFESSLPEGSLDVLNALTLLQIAFSTSVYVYNNQTYGMRTIVDETYESVVHLILQHKPRHHLKPWQLAQSCRMRLDREEVLGEFSDRHRPDKTLSYFGTHAVVQVVERPGGRSELRGAVSSIL